MKSLITSFVLFAAAGFAQAEPLPAPPTVKYTPVAEANCTSQTLNIYFSDGDAALNREAISLLEAAQNQLDGCIIGPVSLRASAADAASPTDAQALAQARLDAVAGAMDDHALNSGRIQIRFDPEAQAAGQASPKSRSVEVQLSAWAPQIG